MNSWVDCGPTVITRIQTYVLDPGSGTLPTTPWESISLIPSVLPQSTLLILSACISFLTQPAPSFKLYLGAKTCKLTKLLELLYHQTHPSLSFPFIHSSMHPGLYPITCTMIYFRSHSSTCCYVHSQVSKALHIPQALPN